jgi:hypothetical protein
MNAATLVWVGIAGLWLVLSLIIAYQDHRDRRARESRMQVRDWEHKVAAMRRMADQEGDA